MNYSAAWDSGRPVRWTLCLQCHNALADAAAEDKTGGTHGTAADAVEELAAAAADAVEEPAAAVAAGDRILEDAILWLVCLLLVVDTVAFQQS